MVRSDHHPSVRTTNVDRFLIAALAIQLFACKQEEAKQPLQKNAAEEFGGWYRATLLKPGVEVPFYLSLPADPTKGGAIVMNGRHWFSAQHRWAGERVEVDFSMYRTKILATVGEEDLFGTWESASRAFGDASVPIRAVRVDNPDPELKLRTATSPPPEVELSGYYKLTFAKSGIGKMLAAKEGPTAVGATLWFRDADTIYVSGNVIGKRVMMSGFDAT